MLATFFALLRRDLLVAGRHAVPLLAGTLTQPVLVILVFGNLMPRLGLVSGEFQTVIVPGLMAITVLMAGVQGVLMPLAGDLAGTREVEERLLAPLGVTGVALEKVVAGAVNAVVAGLLSLPLMMLLMHEVGGVAVHPNWLALPGVVVAAALMSAALGLALGSRVPPKFVGLLFAVLLGPMMLFGCAYFPWSGLARLGAVRYLFLLNPLTFASEGLRWAVTPEIEHMPLPLLAAGLGAFLALLVWLGVRGFERRTIL